jgi:hypothetical protein
VKDLPRWVLGIASGIFLGGEVRASVLDWDVVSWTAGSLTATYTNVDGSGVDMTVTVSGETGDFLNEDGAPTPQISNNITGGLTPAQNALLFYVDWGNENDTITVTVTFSQLVNNVSYDLFDIDRGGSAGGGSRTFVDEISTITATDGTTTYAATIGTSAENTTEGAGTGISIYGNGGNPSDTSGDGNASISYGSSAVNSLTFTYGNRSNSQTNPAAQAISMHDINFTIVPEVPTGIPAVLVCLIAVLATHGKGFRMRRRECAG